VKTSNDIEAVKPVLTVSVDTWRKLQTYVQLCATEISGFGIISQTGPLRFNLEDVFIFEQEATDVHVTVSDEVMHRQLFQLDQAGLKISTVRFQWHSHVNMPAYMSMVDTDNIDRYPGDWMISMVINKRGEFKTRLDVFKPFRLTFPVKVVVKIDPIEELTNEIRSEIGRKVKDERKPLRRFFRKEEVQTSEAVAVAVTTFVPSKEMRREE